ncbi:polyribonucleotide nucleotidyltransferase [bacterium]|nr:polyribonucleotide nucleotidyltransferase [bacterium]
MESPEFSIDLAGRQFSIETGELATQASGSAMVSLGDTRILVAATMGSAREGTDFFPLQCEYVEKFYAAGKISGSRFIKRGGRPSENAILNSRLIDRPIRPLFPKGITNDTQVVCTVMSTDSEVTPGPLAITAASCALMISGMPFEGPVAGVKIGLIEGELILNPTYDQVKEGDLDLVVAGTQDAITMVEAGAKEVDNETIVKALGFAHKYIKDLCALQKRFAEKYKKDEKIEVTINAPSPEAIEALSAFVTEDMLNTIKGVKKKEIKSTIHALEDKVKEKFATELEEEKFSEGDLMVGLNKLIEKNMRKNILEKEERIDGRKIDEIRKLSVKLDLLPRVHGSGLFQRGETQALTVTTLGGPGDAMIVDTMEVDTKKRYMHFYNFPAYSVGEVRPMRGPGRREIGHGALAERALIPVLPDEKDFPYTMVLESEVLTCNGSSSMASVCGSSLSLMAAGVPIKSHVSAIAMGLVTDGEGNYKILSDIQGMEDFAGDMDFKVAGTTKGITALQMDIKIKGLSLELMEEALSRATEARMEVMNVMSRAIPAPRSHMSKYAPLILNMQIDPDKIRDVIGKGGETIQGIIKDCDVDIDINDDGIVTITAPDQEKGDCAKKKIDLITYEPQVGEVFEGKVVRIMDFGAFVEIVPGKDGLVHISQLSNDHVNKVEDVVKLGDTVKVKLMEIDSQGRYNLSMKALLSKSDHNKK